MKRKLLKSCSLLVLAVLIVAVSAQAQTRGSYQAEIPFDFSIGDQVYEAGDYTIRVKTPNYLANILAITNAEGEELKSTALLESGDRSKNDEARLIFDRYGDQYVLKQIVAPRFGFTTPKSKGDVTVRYQGGSKPNPETVSVLLETLE